MTKEQEKNREIQNEYNSWLISEKLNPNRPLEIDGEHTISKFLKIKNLKFEPVLDSRDIRELEEVTGTRKMGRPLVGDKPKNKRSEIRMDEDEKERLVELVNLINIERKKVNEKKLSISEYINSLVKIEWESKNEN